MDNQLTEGQRIDVYEVVDNYHCNPHRFNIGEHVAAKYEASQFYPIQPKGFYFGSINMSDREAVKCGYYLKVKSLNTKGVKNES